jgi:tetratricopeptide (TPR) repeat protein
VRAWLLVLALVAGCRTAGSGPYERPGESERNTFRAQELNAAAADRIASEPEEAARMLRESLTADIFFGPAHNNLGVVHLKAGRLYEAAEEFEWARKLMPGHPDPRMNLALTLEQAGKTDQAIQTYKTALEVWPGHIGTVQALARLEVTSGRRSPELIGWLDQIAFQGETATWRSWAQGEIARERRE